MRVVEMLSKKSNGVGQRYWSLGVFLLNLVVITGLRYLIRLKANDIQQWEFGLIIVLGLNWIEKIEIQLFKVGFKQML